MTTILRAPSGTRKMFICLSYSSLIRKEEALSRRYRILREEHIKIQPREQRRGQINIFPDPDGKFRRIPLLVNYGGGWYPYLSFLAACDYLGLSVKDITVVPGRYLSLSGLRIPMDESSNMVINFSGRWGKTYKHYSYSDIVQSFVAPAIGRNLSWILRFSKIRCAWSGSPLPGRWTFIPTRSKRYTPGSAYMPKSSTRCYPGISYPGFLKE